MLDVNIAANPILNHVTSIVVATGGLGTAAFGIVDVTKSFGGGVSNCGFGSIRQIMARLVPERATGVAITANAPLYAAPPALSLGSMLMTLKSNWINGVSHDQQVAIAKSLIKLRLDAALAASLAALMGLDAASLMTVAAKIASGTALTQSEADVYGRFDLILTTMLDQAYERADQQYRNMSKLCAMIASILLAIGGWAALTQVHGMLVGNAGFWQAVVVGLIATPLAPVAKDVASAIQAGAGAIQAWRS